MRRQLMFLATAAAVAVGGSACDDLTGGDEQPPTNQATTPAPAGTGEPTTPAPAAPPPADGVLASRDVQADSKDLTIDITGLQRPAAPLW